MGPFYCPLDQKIYLDTSFFRDMKNRFGGGGDFAYAMSSRMRWGITSRISLGYFPRCIRRRSAPPVARKRMLSRFASN